MKKFENLGRKLSKEEQKKIIGGNYGGDYCALVYCYNSSHVELGTIYAMRSTVETWLTQCINAGCSSTTTTSGSDCSCSNCTV